MHELSNFFVRGCLTLVLMCATTAAYAATDGSDNETSVGPGPDEMVEIMNAHITGGQLYRKKKYQEALEHLEIAAKGGMKRSQAQLGAILLGMTGASDVVPDTKRGLGWLGVAAHGITEPDYKKSYKDVYKAISATQRPMVDKIVDGYIANFGSDATRVSCERTRRAGTSMARLVCTFDDLHKYRDQLDAETYGALGPDGQITDYAENYRSSSGFGGGGGGGPAGGGGPGGGGGF